MEMHRLGQTAVFSLVSSQVLGLFLMEVQTLLCQGEVLM